jgi:hypothetical protein
MAMPRRMGAALTYARRYALFSLVGIAGEDDLDAPDLHDKPLSPAPPAVDRPIKPGDGQPGISPRMPGNGHARSSMKRERAVVLNPDQSAALREKLLIEVGNIPSADLAAGWAREALTSKNSLQSTDAKFVEDAFARRLEELAATETVAPPSNEGPSGVQVAESQESPVTESADAGPAAGVDKSVLTVAVPRRYRNREHLRFVAQQACLMCGRKPSDAHHLRYMQPRALGRKASDEFVVPLCRVHHRAVHRVGDERAWWKQTGIDPLKVARQLWKHTRVNEGRIAPRRTRKPQISIGP